MSDETRFFSPPAAASVPRLRGPLYIPGTENTGHRDDSESATKARCYEFCLPETGRYPRCISTLTAVAEEARLLETGALKVLVEVLQRVQNVTDTPGWPVSPSASRIKGVGMILRNLAIQRRSAHESV